MPRYVLLHHHEAADCGTAFAAWKGFASPLRHRATIGSCPSGGHRLLWTVEAESERAALDQLPQFLAARTNVVEVSDVPIP